MLRSHLRPVAALLAAGLAALALAAPAGAATYRVSGKQVAVDADNGIFKMLAAVSGGACVRRRR